CLTATLLLTLVLIISAVLAGIGEAFKPGADEKTVQQTVAAASFFGCVNLLLLLFGAVLGCVGWGLCLVVPRRTRTRLLVGVAVGIEGASLLLLLICSVLMLGGPGNAKAAFVFLL